MNDHVIKTARKLKAAKKLTFLTIAICYYCPHYISLIHHSYICSSVWMLEPSPENCMDPMCSAGVATSTSSSTGPSESLRRIKGVMLNVSLNSESMNDDEIFILMRKHEVQLKSRLININLTKAIILARNWGHMVNVINLGIFSVLLFEIHIPIWIKFKQPQAHVQRSYPVFYLRPDHPRTCPAVKSSVHHQARVAGHPKCHVTCPLTCLPRVTCQLTWWYH